jgi:hypothetical protein
MYVQLFEGWRYREGARARLVEMGLAGVPQTAPRPDVPGLIARLLATDTADPETGIGVWVWESEVACRAYEANRPEAVQAAVDADVDATSLVERTFDTLFFGARIPSAE